MLRAFKKPGHFPVPQKTPTQSNPTQNFPIFEPETQPF
jgi:hypothetical protein